MLLPIAGRKIADWLLRGFIQCANIQVLLAQSIMASVHKFGGCVYDDASYQTLTDYCWFIEDFSIELHDLIRFVVSKLLWMAIKCTKNTIEGVWKNQCDWLSVCKDSPDALDSSALNPHNPSVICQGLVYVKYVNPSLFKT